MEKKNFENLNLKKYTTNKDEYTYLLILLEMNNLVNGFKIKKVHKPTEKGTIIEFEKINQEDNLNHIFDDLTKRLGILKLNWEG